ncbi:MAG TPA: glycosyltransferase, partial [Candidatus Angelobacter sp.]|nr:glycosyltransferase [Candidatus Angelobacter sp.]
MRRCLGLGTPILAANCPGVAELIHPEDRESALFDGKSASLGAALQKALREGTRPSRPSQQGEIIQKWFAWHDDWAARIDSHPARQDKPQPLVSVCLIHFNRPQFLTQALNSLRTQDYPHFEVVLVDDGSSDPAAMAMLTALEPEFKTRNWQLVRQENRYLGAARNNGARHARGEYLIFMDDDNFAKPHQISTFVQVAQATGADIVTSAMDLFTGSAKPEPDQKPKARWIFLGGAAGTGAFRNCFGDANACIRREVFLRLGGFTEDYGITHEDWEFHARALLQGCRLETMPEALFFYRVADQSMIRSTSRYANHQRSLRPYLEAVPEPLRDLIHFLQGSVLFAPEKTVIQPGLENLVRSNRRMVAIAKELIPAGQLAAAEAMFLEILNSASSTQLPGVVLQTMLDIGGALVEKNCGAMAEKVLARAQEIARARNDDFALKEAGELLACARNCIAEKRSPSKIPAPASSAEVRKVEQQPQPQPTAPLVSVVIPVFNNLALTQGCLESIARTNNAGILEIIVVDNASTDGTGDFLKSEQAAGRIRCLTNVNNQGFAHACNQGAEAARSSLVVFLNNDTQVTAGWAEAMAQAATLPEVGIVGAKLLYPDGRIQHAGIEFINGIPDHPHRRAEAGAPAVNQFRELDMVTGACFMMHRDLCRQLAGFDEAYQNGVEDIDLCLRARAAGRKVVYEPKAAVYHLEGQSAGRFNHVNENLKLFFERWKGAFDAAQRFKVPQPSRIMTASRSLFLPDNRSGLKPSAAPVMIDWIGSFLDYGSLSHVNRALTTALKAIPDLRVNCVSNGAAPARGFEALASELFRSASPDAMVTIRHAWPPAWRRPAKGKLVVIQPWEFGALPQDWVRQARDVDEFWVPSRFVHDCYLASGVPDRKVFVVPNGVDAETFRPQAAPMTMSTQKKFKFLFV